MQQTRKEVKTVANLNNVRLAARTLEMAVNASPHLPRMVCLYGPSGYGKSSAASWLVTKYLAYYSACNSTWTRNALLDDVLKNMGIVPAKTIYAKLDQVCEQLAVSGRPLVIDEMDYLVDKGALEIVRDIYEGSRAPIMIIGEEKLPAKLQRWERFHNRILEWAPAQPADMDDVAELAGFYCSRVMVADDLLAEIDRITRHNVRRICINLEHVQETALKQGLSSIDLDTWTRLGVPIYTGDAPKRRV